MGMSKDLNFVINAKGGCEEDVRHRIKAAWQNWKDLLSIVCDTKMSAKVKDKVYRTMVRPVMIYAAEAWAMHRNEEETLKRAQCDCYGGCWELL
jgi:hypothetical protein